MTTSTITRRRFIQAAAVAGGGLLLSFYLPSKDESLLSETGEFMPNAWITIAKDGHITIAVAKSEMGQGILTALPMIVAEELDADWTMVRATMVDASASGVYGSQGTGGSYSVRGSWQRLREAGATGRAMLLAAAAKTWSVDPSSCRTEQGNVIHSSGKKISYGELAAVAATIPVPSSVSLKDPKDFRILGSRLPKFETPEKTYGKAVFGLDVRKPGMVFASIQKCPVYGGSMTSFDATKAKAVPGVLDVIQVEDGVAVVANSTWSAFQGREALSVQWSEGTWANQNSDSIQKAFKEAVQSEGTIESHEGGNIEAALANAATRVDTVYEVPFLAHETMEPMNCFADVKGDRCEIWVPSQSPQGAQKAAARILGLSPENITVHLTFLGGGFGRRSETDFVADAVRVSKSVGKPVLLIWTREDDTQHDFYRPASYSVMKGGLDKNGTPVAWHQRTAGATSRGLVMGGSKPPYAFPTYQVDSHILETGVPVGAWRAVGPGQNAFAMECFMDELAVTAKKDPVEFRRALLGNSPRLKRTLEVAAEKSGWGKPLPKGMGRGISCVEGFGSTCSQVAEVSVNKDGSVKVHRIIVAVDCGPVVNPDTIEAQMESGIVYGLTAVLKDEITIDKGRAQQQSYDDYRLLQFDEMPQIEVHIVPSTESVGGIGEVGLPPVAPAVCNAIFAATGKRIRKLPIRPADLKHS